VANLISYQKCVYYDSIKIFNMLPISVAELVTNKKHLWQLWKKKILIDKSLYTPGEYLRFTDVR